MAYDEELADRIRTLLGDRAGLTEQKMFGGMAFLIGGNMAIAALAEWVERGTAYAGSLPAK
jgi:hypothetical protein